MTTHRPFLGDQAEYYRRKVIREAVRPDALIRENEYLRQRVDELEQELAHLNYQLKTVYARKSVFQRILTWLGLSG